MSGYIGVLPVPQTTQTRESFTATAGQTSFGTSGYQIDHLDVYLNGVKLAAADYTATNGSDIVLATGAAVNDILEMVAFETFTIANQSFTGTTTVDTLVVTNTVDGRDVSVDGAKLDTIPIISTSSTPSFTAKGDGTTDGYIQLNCSQNSHGIKLKSPPHSANASYTLTFPNDDGNAGQFLKTNGSGVLSWATDSTTDSTKLPLAGGAMTGPITTNSTFDGVDVATRDAVLTSTTTTAGAALPKAGGVLTGAVTTNSTFDGRDVATDGTKLDTVETNADVTDTANVTSAGALMDSELTNLAAVKAINQSLVTTASPTFAGVSVDGGTIKLDGNYPTGTGNVALGDTALSSGSLSGAQNTAIGSGVMAANTSGARNTAVGYQSLDANTEGDDNVAIGRRSLTIQTTGNNNVAVGTQALALNQTGSENTAVGTDSLLANTTASENTAVGSLSAYSNTTGTRNTALGRASLYDNTTGNHNVALGYDSLANNTTASYNTAVGYLALKSNTTGTNGVAIGFQASLSNTTGGQNTSLGWNAFGTNTTGSNNTAIGKRALHANTTASSNTAVGTNSLFLNTTGATNTAVGYQSMDANTTGVSNVAVGGNALGANITGNNLCAIGTNALLVNTTSGNTTVGSNAGYSNTSGRIDAFGFNAAFNNATGNYNSAFGQQNGYLAALQTNTTGSSNAAFATGSLGYNTTGGSNTGIGVAALYSNTTASYSTAVGYQAGYANTTAAQGTFVGEQAGYSNTTGLGNTFIGSDSGHLNTTGTRNQFFGKNSGESITTGSKNTIIGAYNGNQNGLDIRTSSNNIVLSDGDGVPYAYAQKVTGTYATYKWVFGGNNIVGVGLGAETVNIGETAHGGYCLGITSQDHAVRFIHLSNATTSTGVVGSIRITGSGTTYNTSSDYRLKENVVYDWDATTRLKQLKPARFNFIADADTTVDGFLAHEAHAVVPECVTGTKDEVDEDGNAVMQGIDQSKLVPLLVKTIQELEARITALEGA